LGFEWDEYKRQANIARHGIGFEDAIAVWESWPLAYARAD
jgi:uncharacterized DUF497 family protein